MFFQKFFEKSLVKININKKSKKNNLAYSRVRNLRMACLWSLDLDQHNAQKYILNVSLKGTLYCFFHLEKIKKQNAFQCKLKKKLKGPPFQSQKCIDQKNLGRGRTS